MLGLLHLLLVGFVSYVAVTTALVVVRLRRPPRRTYASAVARSRPGDPGELPVARPFSEFTFEPSPGHPALPAWDIPGDDPSGPTIVCTPGWGDSRLGVLDRLEALTPLASRIIAWDPAGLGDSPRSTRSALGTDADVRALRALLARLDTGTGRGVVLFGWSMGAGISIVAGAELSAEGSGPLAVVAEAPYRFARTPVDNFLRLVRMPRTLSAPLAAGYLALRLRGSFSWASFDRARYASRLECPLLVIHGTLDEICPHADGQQIAGAAPVSLFISIPGAGHNDLWIDEPFRAQCVGAVRDFLRAVPGMSRRAP